MKSRSGSCEGSERHLDGRLRIVRQWETLGAYSESFLKLNLKEAG